MVQWVNRSLIQAPRNGTTSHTVSFTPATAGNLLVCVAEGAVTSTTPTGWTLPAERVRGQQHRTLRLVQDRDRSRIIVQTTHNGSNYLRVRRVRVPCRVHVRRVRRRDGIAPRRLTRT